MPLETEAAESRKQAESLKRTADDLREGAALQLEGKDLGYRDALQELDRLRRDRSDLQTQLDRAAGENALLRRQLEGVGARQRTTAPRQGPGQPGPTLALATRRTVQAGVSAGPVGGTAGTICCFVRDARGQTYALSADHVFPRAGAMIVQPASMDGGGADDVIAEVTRVLEPGSGANRAAGAIARLLPGVEGASGRFSGIAEQVRPGQALRVFGRTTRAGRGQVTAVDLALNIATGSKPARFAGLIGTTRMSQPGDSGAPVVTPDNRLVGFVYGGSETMTVVMPIRPVLEALGVELVP